MSFPRTRESSISGYFGASGFTAKAGMTVIFATLYRWHDTRLELAVCYAALNRNEDAKTEVTEILKTRPDFSLEMFSKGLPYRDPEYKKTYLDLLRKAGLKWKRSMMMINRSRSTTPHPWVLCAFSLTVLASDIIPLWTSSKSIWRTKGSTKNNFTFLHPVSTSSSSDLKPQKHQNSLLFHQLLWFEIKQI